MNDKCDLPVPLEPLENLSVLIPTLPFEFHVIPKKLDFGQERKLFKGEHFRAKAHTIDDPFLYYVDRGRICMMFERESGENTVMFWRDAGGVFTAQYVSDADIGRYSVSFVAVENTVLYSFSQRQLQQFSAEDPEFFYELLRTYQVSLCQFGHRISNVAHQSPMVSIGMWIQKICACLDANADGSYDILCDMTIKQISELLMIHETSCAKAISELQRQGLILRRRKVIHVADVNKLEEYTQARTA